MSDHPPGSLGDLRAQRVSADDWITYASWTAMGTAVVGAVLALTLLLDDFGGFADVTPFLSTLAGQFAFGYKLRDKRSQWAAWALMVSYVAGFVLSTLTLGILSGLVPKLLVGYVYVRGFLASIEYEDLQKRIAAAESAAGPPAT